MPGVNQSLERVLRAVPVPTAAMMQRRYMVGVRIRGIPIAGQVVGVVQVEQGEVAHVHKTQGPA